MTTPAARKLVLVHERDGVTATFVASLLEASGYQVIRATELEAAYRAFLEQRPHAVIAELTEDSEDGLALLKAIRRDAERAGTPFLVLSERTREAEIVRAFREGVDDYVTKPFNARELLARVHRLLERCGEDR